MRLPAGQQYRQALLYNWLPRFTNSTAFCSMPFCNAAASSTPSCAAKSRTSWEIFIEQKLGPHIEQKCATLSACCWHLCRSWVTTDMPSSVAPASQLGAVPFSRYLCTITETMEQCLHELH